jgi:hypothetical protein
MKAGYFLILFMVFSVPLLAQPAELSDTVSYNAEEMKKIFIVRKTETVQPVSSTPLIVTEASDDHKSKTVYKPLKSYRSKPTMVSDAEGLMNLVKLEPFPDGSKTPKTESYVIFSFSINEWGFISEIVIYGTNDRVMVDNLIHKINRTRWKPAYDSDGKQCEYSFGNWIAKMPSSVKPREYEDYRF